MMGKYKQRVTEIRNMRDLQRNSIIDEYMTGLYNGLELALSILEEREAEFATFTSEPEVIETEEGEQTGRTVASGILRR